jgi:ABC-type transport system involved in cytochrome c biogenesis permease subunit
MEAKYTIEGLLIYMAMAAYLFAALAFWRGAVRGGWSAFLAGFVVMIIAYVYRWVTVGHVPLQNLFEVFLCLGMLVLPLCYGAQRWLGVHSPAADGIIGIVTLFPAGFVFNAQPQQLPPALQSSLFVPHVAAYMISYILMSKAAVQAGAHLLSRRSGTGPEERARELATYKMVRLGFPLLTAGLILGAVWGKIAWGDYWNWDPKELWSLASWLIFVGYLHFRYAYRRRFARANSMLVLLGMTAIVCTLLWANLAAAFSGLHSYAV